MSLELVIEFEFGNVEFVEREKLSNRRKASPSREEKKQQTQPTYDMESGNWNYFVPGLLLALAG